MKIIPHAWKDKPALIEVAFPAQKISLEAQCERKAGAGQTLTGLGSYWKGRKPLVLVRACILGALLPASDDPEADVALLEALLAMDDDTFVQRPRNLSKDDVRRWGGTLADSVLDEDGSWKVRGADKSRSLGKILATMPYNERLDRRSLRPEELPAEAYAPAWAAVRERLGIEATSHGDLVEKLGILRFGRRPKVADVFCGGGSIPFEAARVGCEAFGSDLNPIACMLTWGAFNIVGASLEAASGIQAAQSRVAEVVAQRLDEFGVETDSEGNRAKAFLYCLEATCPETGWTIPLSGSWVISKNKRTVAKLSPRPDSKSFDIDVVCDATDADLEAAAPGTVRDGDMVYTLDGVERRVPIRTLRGDRRVAGETTTNLRKWEKADIVSRRDDMFRERLYCVQWVKPNSRDAFFSRVSDDDLRRERAVESLVHENLAKWQSEGLVPDMAIESGAKTDEPIRTRGWSFWHQLFPPRHLLYFATAFEACREITNPHVAGAVQCLIANSLDKASRLSRWRVGHSGKKGVAPAGDYPEQVFYNQALNVFYNYAARAWSALSPIVCSTTKTSPIAGHGDVITQPAAECTWNADLFITDPPYADAVSYAEITEYFIAWLRRNPAEPFSDWVWDSRRDLAIRGAGEEFRHEMVKAYTALAHHMPDNGMQIVMFTHQDARVWGDMAGIFWAAGLRVTAAWYIATETTSELKKGGYVQGTVILVLRKRTETRKAYKDELVIEVREEVKKQLETMIGLNQQIRARGRSENLFEDADLQMAGYAAALRVLTGYTAIDGIDMTREALRPRMDGEGTIVDELIEFAVAIANEELVPDGLDAKVWEKLVGAERFYLRMLDLEAVGLKKLDNYQNFAKAFRVADWQPLMATVKANNARLKSAREFKRAEFGENEFGSSLLRAVLFAMYEVEAELETDEVMSHLRDNVQGYYNRRADIVAVASYLASKLERIRDDEAGAARVLRDLVKGERLGA